MNICSYLLCRLYQRKILRKQCRLVCRCAAVGAPNPCARLGLTLSISCARAQDTGISSKAMSIMNSFINDIFEKIGAETAVRLPSPPPS